MNRIMHPIEPEEVMAYVDGELPAEQAAVTAAHLRECAECQSLIAELGNISQSLKSWELEAPKVALPPALAVAPTGSKPKGRGVFLAPRKWREALTSHLPAVAWAGGVAVLLLVMFGTVRFQRSTPDSVFSEVGSQIPQGESVSLQPPDQKARSRMAPASPRTSVAVASSAPTAQFDRLETFSQLSTPPERTGESAPATNAPEVGGPKPSGPMIIRTAELSVITKEFDKARANLESILNRHHGYVGELKVGGSTGSGRTLTATLRVPADQLDATLTEVKALGRVESESQSGQDVTSQYVDLQARLANARDTERRLTDLLRDRTGKLSDVLDVEREASRVRGEIEQMEAERKTMSSQVTFASLNATITEDYRSELQVVPPSTTTRLSNAAIEGYRNVTDGILSFVLFLLSSGPTLLVWGIVLFFPARLAWKKVRNSLASQSLDESATKNV